MTEVVTGYGAPTPSQDEASKAAVNLRNATARLLKTLGSVSDTHVPDMLYSQSGCLNLTELAGWAHSCGYVVGWTLTGMDGEVYV